MNSDTGSAVGQAGVTAASTALMTANPWAIGIAAGASLLSGLMGAKARREEEERKRKLEAQTLGLQTQANAAQNHTQQEQAAFQNMVNNYTSAIRG